MTESFDGVEITTTDNQVKRSIIWLHGLGADGNDFAPLVPELERAGVTATRYVFPHAPVRSITINGGMQMRGWYDIYSLDFVGGHEDEAGIRDSQRTLEDLIAQEIARGLSSQQIVIAGFSQGGAIALHTALRYPKPLAGLIALSTYLPLADQQAHEHSAENAQLPILMAHGSYDEVIPIGVAEQSRRQLQELGYQPLWHSYPIGHSLAADEVSEIAKWLRQH